MTRIYLLARDRVEPATFMAAAGLVSALLVGVGLAVDIPLGVATLLGVIYVSLVFVNFALAICLWIPLVFLDAVPALNLAGKAAGLLLIVGWVGVVLAGGTARSVVSRHRRLFETMGVLVVWLTLSIAWAPSTGQAITAAWQWWAVGLVFLIVATTIATEQTLVIAIAMYVAGAVVAVVVGIATGGLSGGEDGRLEGPVGDPNFLAAALVSAIPLALALSSFHRASSWRWLWFGSVALMTLGVVSSQSRGGFAAAIGMWVAAIVVLPRRRQVFTLGVAVAAVAAVAFFLNPGSWERVSSPDSGGTGRVDLWIVAWNVFEDHPVGGVGSRNFGRVAPNYVREVGPLDDVQLVVKAPDREVHNSYLELLAENGIVGLALFVVVLLGCLRAALRAASLFDALGKRELVAVSHGLFVGSVGLLAGFFFLSPAIDRRIWILVGLSLAALDIAHRAASAGVPRVSELATPWTRRLSAPREPRARP